MADKKINKKKNEVKIKLNTDNIRKVVEVFSGKLNKMLSENVQENVELGTKKVGNTRVDYGVRLKFLDDDKKDKKVKKD